MEYEIVTDENHLDLAEKVSVLLKEGWQPQGGVAVTAWYERWEGRDGWDDKTCSIFAQALIRPAQGKKGGDK